MSIDRGVWSIAGTTTLDREYIPVVDSYFRFRFDYKYNALDLNSRECTVVFITFDFFFSMPVWAIKS